MKNNFKGTLLAIIVSATLAIAGDSSKQLTFTTTNNNKTTTKRIPFRRRKHNQELSLNALSRGLSKLPKEFEELEIIRNQQKNRYRTIKTIAKNAQYELDFWMERFSEHALFLHLAIEDKELKQKGVNLHNKFEKYRMQMSRANMHKSLPLLKELRDYKVSVLSELQTGKWIGWIFPSLARHMILEVDYVVDKLNDIHYTDRQEVAFWNQINGDHAGTSSHLLDPAEKELAQKAGELSNKFKQAITTEEEMMVQLSLYCAKELDAYFQKAQKKSDANEVKSVIHPVLLEHIMLEGQRSIAILDSLADKTGAIYPPNIAQK